MEEERGPLGGGWLASGGKEGPLASLPVSNLLPWEVTLEERPLPFLLPHPNWEKRHRKKRDHLGSSTQTNGLWVMHPDIFTLQMVHRCVRLCVIMQYLQVQTLAKEYLLIALSTWYTCEGPLSFEHWCYSSMRRGKDIPPAGLCMGPSHSQADLSEAGLAIILTLLNLW